MLVCYRGFVFSILILSVLILTETQNADADFCMHSFEQFAYEGPRDPEEPPQPPTQPWQAVDVENVPESYHISHVELARQHIADTEIWLNAGTDSAWPTEIYAPQIFEYSERIWIIYNLQTNEPEIISPKIQDDNLVVYKLFVDSTGALWGHILPTAEYEKTTFPILSVFNESTHQFELIEGMLEISTDYYHNIKIIPDTNSMFWILVSDDALYSVNTESLAFKNWIDFSDIEPRFAARAIDGTLYFSTNLGDPSSPGWASLSQETMYRFSPTIGELTQVTIPEEWPIYRGLLSDHKGQLWLGSIGFRGIDGVWNLLHTDTDLFFRDTLMGGWLIPTLILESSDGRLWYKNWWDGGIWWKGTAWYDPEKGEGCMFTNYYSSIVEDKNQRLWMVANGKLYKYDINSG
jgi:hypothetical protein